MSSSSYSSSESNAGSISSSPSHVLTMIENQTDQMLLLKEGRGIWRQEMRYRIEPWSTVVIRLDHDDVYRQGAALIMYNVEAMRSSSNLEECNSPVYVPIEQLLSHKRIVVSWKRGSYLWTGQTR